MKIIIVGIGKLGEYLAKCLVKDNNEVTLIDKSFETTQNIINNEDLNYICGNGLDHNVLLEAGIKDCDLLISVMAHDEQNVICSLLGKKLGAKSTIARVRKPEYTNSLNIIKDELGLSMTINPELLTANLISRVLSIPSALNATSFLKGKIQTISLKVKENSNLIGITLNSLNRHFKSKIIMFAIERNGETIIPKGTTKLALNDKIYITGTMKDINAFLKFEKLVTGKIKKVLIVGGSKISSYLAKTLIDMGMIVKIIDIDKEKCKNLSEAIPKAIIINGDASDQNLLYEEGIGDCDAFISLTNIDEENIVYSMFASNLNVPKIITKINHIELDGIVNKANIDTIITPHKIASNNIVKYVRAMQNSAKSKCDAIYRFDNSNFEMLEFSIKEDFKKIDNKLKDIKLKEGILVVAILRGKNIIFPSGNDTININDTIVVVNNERKIIDINDILE